LLRSSSQEVLSRSSNCELLLGATGQYWMYGVERAEGVRELVLV
jgi:hypothetical protein